MCFIKIEKGFELGFWKVNGVFTSKKENQF